jgi:hypothetical protein
MTGPDPKGYYACLGVTPSASIAEIKAAYRRLAKECHPDKNTNAGSKWRFQGLQEAYQTLGDPEGRSAYDRLQYQQRKQTERNTVLQPLRCCRCTKITAQPRAIVFRYVVSFLVMTARNPIQGIYCATCARKDARKASATSILAGWWGFPWGPIFTITETIRNSLGGTYSKEAEEQLQWYNALAFASQGNYSISYALARKLRFAGDEEISLRSLELMQWLHSAGVSSTTPPLKNPWRPHFSTILGHTAAVCALPVILTAALFHKEIDRSVRPTVTYRTASAGISTAGPNATQASLTPNTVSSRQEKATCPNVPPNGALLKANDDFVFSNRGHSLAIHNGSGGNAIVKVRNTATGTVTVSFFVQSNSAAEIKSLPDGTYRVQYATGGELAPNCTSFTNIVSPKQMPDESLVTEYRGTQIVRKQLSYTLYTVPSGNVRPQSLSTLAFLAD